jgi:hypothetical protein
MSCIAEYIDSEYNATIIVPMTVVEPAYLMEIAYKREEGMLIHQFTLCASREMLLRRLRSRGEGMSSWAAQQMDRCDVPVSLGHRTAVGEDVAETIAAQVGIMLLPRSRSKGRRIVWQIFTQIRHIRFFD